MTHTHDFSELGRITLADDVFAVAVAECPCGAFSFATDQDFATAPEWLRISKVASAIMTASLPHVEDGLGPGV